MLSSITIEGFRGIKTGTLSDLTPLVVLAGPNSAGKSTILDAILLAASPDPAAVLETLLGRRPHLQNPQKWLLWRSGLDEAKEAKIQIKTIKGRLRTVEILRRKENSDDQVRVSCFDPNADLNKRPVVELINNGKIKIHRDRPLEEVPEVRLVDAENTADGTPLHALYTRVAERGLRREAKAIMTALIPRLEDVEILTQANEPVVYLVYDDGARPVELAGDGIRLLLRQTLQMSSPAGGIVLLEEPEVHMHPGAILQIARVILATIRRGIQIILTTHSLDLIDALLATAGPDDLPKMSFYRLQLERGVLKSHFLSGAEASLARTQIEDDLR